MRPLLLPLLACLSTGCVHTHPVGMLERDARKQDREWTRAVEEAPEDGLYWVHRPEVLSVAVSAVGTFGDLVQVQAARVDSDWAYKVSSGIDENGEWHAQERERVLAEIRGSNELGLSMVKRSESRRIRAGLKPAGWAGGDAPWTWEEGESELSKLETKHLARPTLTGEEPRFRRLATELSPKGYAVVTDEPGRLVVERYLTEGRSGKGGKTASWHHRSQIELLITYGGVVDVQTRAEHRFDTEKGEGDWVDTEATDALSAREWIKELLGEPRSGLKIGESAYPTPPPVDLAETAPPRIPPLRTMTEIQRLITNKAVHTSSGEFRVCMVGALLPRANPGQGSWDTDPAVDAIQMLPDGEHRIPREALRNTAGPDRVFETLDATGRVERELVIVDEFAAREGLSKQAGQLEKKGWSQLRLPLHPDTAGRMEATGSTVKLDLVEDKLTVEWGDACIERSYKDGLPVLRVELWDEEDEGKPEPIANCDIDLPTVLARGDQGIECGDARVFLNATYLFDMDQIDVVGLPKATE